MNTQNETNGQTREQLLNEYNEKKTALQNMEKELFFMPNDGENYYYVEIDGSTFTVGGTTFDGGYSADRKRVEMRNCFKTRVAAEKALEKVKELFISVEH